MRGAYERHLLTLLAQLAQEAAAQRGASGTFLDVGANVGQHTLFMSRRAAHVVAVEPLPRFAARLERALAANGRDNATLLRFGLGAAEATLAYQEDPSAVQTGSFDPAVRTIGAPRIHRLPVRRGDDALAELSVPAVQLVKIDTDGFEAEVLAGLRDTLRRDRPAIVMEYSPMTRAKLPDLAALLAAVPEGYEVFEIGARRWGGGLLLRPARQRPESGDLLLRPARQGCPHAA